MSRGQSAAWGAKPGELEALDAALRTAEASILTDHGLGGRVTAAPGTHLSNLADALLLQIRGQRLLIQAYLQALQARNQRD